MRPPPPRRGLGMNPTTTLLLLAAGVAVAYGSYKYITYKRRVQRVAVVNGREQIVILDEACTQDAPGAMKVLVDEQGNPAPSEKQPYGYRPPVQPPAGYTAAPPPVAAPPPAPSTSFYAPPIPAPPGYPIPAVYPQQPSTVAMGYPAATAPPYCYSSADGKPVPPPIV